MEFEYIDMRETLPSGGSVKVTIPIKIVKEIWKKAEEMLSEGQEFRTLTIIKRFLVCFIRSNKKVILELPEDVVKSIDYPEELRSKVSEDLLKHLKRSLAKEWDEIYMKFARGIISELEFEEQFKRFKKSLKEMAEYHREVFSERELRFIALDSLSQLISIISVEEEKEKEENFLDLIEDVKKIKDELESTKDVLKCLEEGFNEGRISLENYEVLKERYFGKLTLAEDRLNRLKKLLDDP